MKNPALTPTHAPGFLDGVACFAGGTAFVLTRRSAWTVAAFPVVNHLSAIIYLINGASAWILHEVPPASVNDTKIGIITGWLHDSWSIAWMTPFVGVALGTLAVVQPLSAFVLDVIAREHLVTQRVWEFDHWSDSLFRSAETTVSSLLVALPIIFGLSRAALLYPAAWQLTTLLALVVAGLALAWNFIDYPLRERELGPLKRVAFLWQHFDAMLGFGLASAVFMMVPVLGLLVLPVGVVGGARLIVACDRSDAAKAARAT